MRVFIHIFQWFLVFSWIPWCKAIVSLSSMPQKHVTSIALGGSVLGFGPIYKQIGTEYHSCHWMNLFWNPPTIILSLVLWAFSTRKTLLHCYFCWWRGAHCWHSPPNPPTLPRSVCACVYVCFRKWCRASLCKFIHDTAETKISLLKSARQPFGGLMPCLSCVLYM